MGHEELNILKLSDISYKSSNTVDTGLLDCLSDVVEANMKAEMASFPVVTALADESTDNTNNCQSQKACDLHTYI